MAKKRLWTLWWPIVGWGIVYAISLLPLVAAGLYTMPAEAVFWQILTGHSPYINPSMWFQTDLIIITALFGCIVGVTGKSASTYILTAIFIICYILQYTGVNAVIYGGMRYELEYPLGRIAETMPYAVIGYLTGGILSKLKIDGRLSIMAGMWTLTLFILGRALINIPAADGYGYAGIDTLICSVMLFLFFYFIFTNTALQTLGINRYANLGLLVKKLTSYTLGIYCIHRLTAVYTLRVCTALDIHLSGVTLCIIIYILSYLACWVIDSLNIRSLTYLVK